MVKDFVVVADLGAAGNLIRNLMLLGETDWPLLSDRLERILDQYPSDLQLSNWLQKEYQLRFWQRYYNLDLSNELNYSLYQEVPATALPKVWINHSAFWQPTQLETFIKHCNIIYVAPVTDAGLEWQIRSYAIKKTIPLLHDFCFEHDQEQQKQDYIDTYGTAAYYLFNITNMKHIIGQRQHDFRLQMAKCIDLEVLINGTPMEIHQTLKQATGLDIAVDAIGQVVAAWRALHWSDTADWEYHTIFQQ